MSTRVEVFLALGGNVGNTKELFKDTCNVINERVGKVIVRSSLYLTSALNPSDDPNRVQNDFLNCVIKIETSMTPEDLLSCIQELENEFGRQRKEEIYWGPRPLDIDILTYGKSRIAKANLNIPHSEFEKRDFVLFPILEIQPDFIHPVTELEIQRQIEKWKENGGVSTIKAIIGWE